MGTLVARLATTPHDAESMRRVRNTCAVYMTRSRALITPAAQQVWWDGLDRERIAPYVYELDGKIVGYGLVVRSDDGRRWVTGGLLPDARGVGHGRSLFQHLVDTIRPDAVWLEVLRDNPAYWLYVRLGFHYMGEEDRPGVGAVYTMWIPPAEDVPEEKT